MLRYKIVAWRNANREEIVESYTIQGWDDETVMEMCNLDVEFLLSRGLSIHVEPF